MILSVTLCDVTLHFLYCVLLSSYGGGHDMFKKFVYVTLFFMSLSLIAFETNSSPKEVKANDETIIETAAVCKYVQCFSIVITPPF